jgi:hypothetical protein
LSSWWLCHRWNMVFKAFNLLHHCNEIAFAVVASITFRQPKLCTDNCTKQVNALRPPPRLARCQNLARQ